MLWFLVMFFPINVLLLFLIFSVGPGHQTTALHEDDIFLPACASAQEALFPSTGFARPQQGEADTRVALLLQFWLFPC